ncbi:MAG: hypothetical protein U0893_14485 [Chloroflexota bacterium]
MGHALADLLPLDRLAARVAALLRPGGLAHLALTYDGLTVFDPPTDPDLDEKILKAFHREMDRPGRKVPHHGGSTAGRRLAPALASAGLEVVVDAPSVWDVRASDGDGGRELLLGLVRFVNVPALAGRKRRIVGPSEWGLWRIARHLQIHAGTLTARVGHRDVLARRPLDS